MHQIEDVLAIVQVHLECTFGRIFLDSSLDIFAQLHLLFVEVLVERSDNGLHIPFVDFDVVLDQVDVLARHTRNHDRQVHIRLVERPFLVFRTEVRLRHWLIKLALRRQVRALQVQVEFAFKALGRLA